MPKKLEPEVTSTDYDDSLPSHVERNILEFTGGELILSKLRSLISNYRFESQNAKAKATKSAVIRHLDKTYKQTNDLLQSLAIMPQDAQAIMASLYNQSAREGFIGFAGTFLDLRQRLEHDLATTQELISHTIALTEEWNEGGPGEKPKTLEHQLLSQVTQLLERHAGKPKIEAAGKAADLLRSSGVPNMPSDPEKARRIVRENEQAGDSTQ